MYTVRTYIHISVLLCSCRNTWISTNINAFEVLFCAVHQANSVMQSTQGVIGTTSRYEGPTLGKVYLA